MKISFWEYNLCKNKSNQKPYMIKENQACKMVYFTNIIGKIFTNIYIPASVSNYESTKSPAELNSLFTWFDEMWHWRWRPCKRGLYIKSYCFFETIAQQFKNYKLESVFEIRPSSARSSETNYMSLCNIVKE